MSLPDHILDWIRNHCQDRKAMEELHTALRVYQAARDPFSSVPEGVEQVLKCISLARVTAGDIADLLCMSQRSLNRKLQARNTSFRRLVDAERRRRYLAHEVGVLTSTEMAAMLGFKDAKSFYRARKRWALEREAGQ